jgi:hypothetical protein
MAELLYSDLIFDLDEDGDYLELGSGASSRVYAGVFNLSPCAIKVFPGRGVTSQHLSAFWRECNLQRSLHSEQVVSVLGGALDRKSNGEIRSMAIVMERLRQTLKDLLASKEGGGVDLLQRLKILMDIVRGVRFLHACDIVHGDLKPANVLLGDGCCAKLADFGLARVRKEGVEATLSRTGQGAALGSPRYMDPALHNKGALLKSSDMYSFGVMAWEVLTGLIPYADLELLDLIKHVSPPLCGRPGLEALPPPVAALGPLLKRCWAPAQAERPTAGEACRGFEEALEHLQRAARAAAAVGSALAPSSSPSPSAGAQAQCTVCLCTEALSRGCTCSAGHFTCRECLQGVAQMDAGPERVGEMMGEVRCPWRGGIGAGTASICPSQPWSLDEAAFSNALEPTTLRILTLAAQAALKIARSEAERLRARGEGSAGGRLGSGGGSTPTLLAPLQQASLFPPGASPTSSLPLNASPRAAATGSAPPSQPLQPSAPARAALVPAASVASVASVASAPPAQQHQQLSPAEFSERVRLHRQRLSEELLVHRCPRCLGAFFDYSGCAALMCERQGCGAHFCALCPFVGNSREVHKHLREPAHPGVGSGYNVSVEIFNTFHSERRRLAVAQAVSCLPEDRKVAAAVWAELCRDMGVPVEGTEWGMAAVTESRSSGSIEALRDSGVAVLRKACRECADAELLLASCSPQQLPLESICAYLRESQGALAVVLAPASADAPEEHSPVDLERALDSLEFAARVVIGVLGGEGASFDQRQATLAARGQQYTDVCNKLHALGGLITLAAALKQCFGLLGEEGEDAETALLLALANSLAAVAEVDNEDLLGLVEVLLARTGAAQSIERATGVARLCCNVFRLYSRASLVHLAGTLLRMGEHCLGDASFAFFFSKAVFYLVYQHPEDEELQLDDLLVATATVLFAAWASGRSMMNAQPFLLLSPPEEFESWWERLSPFSLPTTLYAVLRNLAATSRTSAYAVPALRFACSLLTPVTAQAMDSAQQRASAQALIGHTPVFTAAQLLQAGLVPVLVDCQRAFDFSLPASVSLVHLLYQILQACGEPAALALCTAGSPQALLTVLNVHCATRRHMPAKDAMGVGYTLRLLRDMLESPDHGEAALRGLMMPRCGGGGSAGGEEEAASEAAGVLVDTLTHMLRDSEGKSLTHAATVADCIGCVSSGTSRAWTLACIEAGAMPAIAAVVDALLTPSEGEMIFHPNHGTKVLGGAAGALCACFSALGNLYCLGAASAGSPEPGLLVSLACALERHRGNAQVCAAALRVLALCTTTTTATTTTSMIAREGLPPLLSAASGKLLFGLAQALAAHGKADSGVLVFSALAVSSAAAAAACLAAPPSSSQPSPALPPAFISLGMPKLLVAALGWTLGSQVGSGAAAGVAACLGECARCEALGGERLGALLEAGAVEHLVSALQKQGSRGKAAVAEAAVGALRALVLAGRGGREEAAAASAREQALIRAVKCGGVKALVDVCWLFASFPARDSAVTVLSALGFDERGVRLATW